MGKHTRCPSACMQAYMVVIYPTRLTMAHLSRRMVPAAGPALRPCPSKRAFQTTPQRRGIAARVAKPSQVATPDQTLLDNPVSI